MTFPIRTKSRSLKSWFASEPTRFIRERSPRKTVFWGIVIAVGVIATVLALVNPAATIDNFSDARRSLYGVIFAFGIGPFLTIAGIVFQFVNIQHYRLVDGGVLRRNFIRVIAAGVDPTAALEALTSGDPARVKQGIAMLDAVKADPRLEVGQQVVCAHQVTEDRVGFIGVLRMDASTKGVLYIDREPLTYSGDRFLDINKTALQP